MLQEKSKANGSHRIAELKEKAHIAVSLINTGNQGSVKRSESLGIKGF